MARLLVIGLLLVLAGVGCGGGGGDEQSEPAAEGEAGPPRALARGWETDFSKHSVPFDEFLSGGPPKDGIPAVDEPKFVAVGEVDSSGSGSR